MGAVSVFLCEKKGREGEKEMEERETDKGRERGGRGRDIQESSRGMKGKREPKVTLLTPAESTTFQNDSYPFPRGWRK